MEQQVRFESATPISNQLHQLEPLCQLEGANLDPELFSQQDVRLEGKN